MKYGTWYTLTFFKPDPDFFHYRWRGFVFGIMYIHVYTVHLYQSNRCLRMICLLTLSLLLKSIQLRASLTAPWTFQPHVVTPNYDQSSSTLSTCIHLITNCEATALKRGLQFCSGHTRDYMVYRMIAKWDSAWQ